ncbi:MAG: phosphatase PAP2 family protein [Gemmatimonadota bacterium]
MIRPPVRRVLPRTTAVLSLLLGSMSCGTFLKAQPLVSSPTFAVSPAASAPFLTSARHALHGGIGWRAADGWKLGGMAVLAGVVATADRRGDAWARRAGVQENGTLDALAAAGDAGGTWGAIGVGPAAWVLGRARGDSGTAMLGLRTTEAVVLTGATIAVIKAIAGRTRPFASADQSPTHWDLFGGRRSDSTRSFVSAHAGMSAAAAVTLAAEWRRQGRHGWRTVGPPMVYALAGVVAGSRVRDRQHWLSDVVAGAAVGTLGALAVRRWHDAHPRSLVDRLLLAH